MSNADKALEIAKSTFDKTKKLSSSLAKMTGEGIKGGYNVGTSATRTVVNNSSSFVDFILYSIIFIIYSLVIFFNLDIFISSINFVDDYVPGFVFFSTWFVWGLFVIITLTIPMGFLGLKKEKFEFIESVGKLILILFVLSFIFGYFLNSEKSILNNENVAEAASEKTFSIFDQIGCYAKDYKACREKVENTETAKESDIAVYSVNMEKVIISNYKDLSEYMEDGLRVQYDIESRGDLILKEFKCYHTSKRVENVFYSEKLNFEVTERNQGLLSYYCKNFSKLMFGDKNGDVRLSIYPTLIFDLKSKITQQVPVLNANKLSEEDINDEKDRFVKKYTDFTDTGSKLEVKSEVFKKQMPVILGDEKVMDRGFSITIRKKISSFGKFVTGEILEVRIPSSLKSKKEVSKYLGEITLVSEVHQLEFYVEDNEEFGESMSQDKIVQSFEIDYVSTFYKSASIELKVKVPEDLVGVDGSKDIKKDGEDYYPEDYQDPNKEISGIGPGIVG